MAFIKKGNSIYFQQELSLRILSVEDVIQESKECLSFNQNIKTKKLFGINDGKTLGTHIENIFFDYLENKGYLFKRGNPSKGIDFPELDIDIKSNSSTRSKYGTSSPFRSFEQKIYGMGYSIVLFIYDKIDIYEEKTATLSLKEVFFIDKEDTADKKTTSEILEVINNGGTEKDMINVLIQNKILLDLDSLKTLSHKLFLNPPKPGLLSINDVLQWNISYNKSLESTIYDPK